MSFLRTILLIRSASSASTRGSISSIHERPVGFRRLSRRLVNNCVRCGIPVSGPKGNLGAKLRVHRPTTAEGFPAMKGIVAWLIGIPIPIIIILYLTDVF